MLKRLTPYFAGAAMALLALFAFKPVQSLPDEFAIGAHVPPRAFEDALKKVSTRSTIEHVTRTVAQPTSSARADSGASTIVTAYIAAAGQQQDSSTASVDLTKGKSMAPAPAVGERCLGAGGSSRVHHGFFFSTLELKLLSACVPSRDGLIDRYRGNNPDWSYLSGHAGVTVSRVPDVVQLMQVVGFAAFGYGIGAHDPRFAAGGVLLVAVQAILF